MKRDMDLIRYILLDLEAEGKDDSARYTLSDYPKEAVGYHCWLLIGAGLAEGAEDTGLGDTLPQAYLTSLTWGGHDFLDAARNETTWNKAKATVRENAGTVAFEVFKAVLIAVTKNQLGL
jgi:hypothetical protein